MQRIRTGDEIECPWRVWQPGSRTRADLRTRKMHSWLAFQRDARLGQHVFARIYPICFYPRPLGEQPLE